MKKKYLTLAVLNFALAALWAVMLIVGVMNGELAVLIVLRAVCAALAVVCGVLDVLMYQKQK